jgi:hypothetical protein
MAGGSVGVIFAELDLDASRYTRGQQKLLQDATTTTLNIEQNFKNLGIKSSAEMDLMRQKIQNSFDMITNSAKASATDKLRAEQAYHDKLKALDEQQFGRQTSLLSTLKSNWIAFSAAAATAIYAVNKAWDLAKVGAEYQEQQGILDNLSSKYGTTADAIVEAMETASSGLISKADLMTIALGGIAKGLKPDELTALADAAEILGDACGVTATVALQDLTQAMETGKTRALLPYLGTSIDLEAAFGELASKMTAAEKAQAMLNMTIIKATELQAQQTKGVNDAADKIERMEAAWANAKLKLAEFAATLVVSILDAPAKINAMSASVDLLTGETIKVTEATKEANVAHKESADILSNVVLVGNEVMIQAEAKLAQIKNTVQARVDDTKAVKENAEAGKKAADDAIVAEKKRYDYFIAREGEWLTESEKNAAELTKGKGEEYDKDQKNWIDKLKYKQKKEEEYLEWSENQQEEYHKGMAEWKAEEVKDAIKAAEKRGQYEREIYKDLRGYANQYYASEEALIQAQAEKYKAAGVDQVAVAVWVAQQLDDLNLKKLKSSDSFVDGVKAGYLEMQRDATTFGESGYQIFKTFADSSKTALSDILFQGFKTGTIDAQAVWETFSDTMLRKFTDTLATMVVEAAAKDVLMMFQAEWTAESSNILGIINKGLEVFNWLTGSGGGGGGGGGWQPTAPLQGEAYGGLIQGYTAGGDSKANDTILAMLSPGEFVMPRSAVNDQTLPLLEMMRQGGLRGYAEGGVVDALGNEGTAAQIATLEAFRKYWENLQGFGKGAEPLFRPYNYNNDDDWWITPDGQLHDTRHANRGFLDWAIPAIIAVGGGYATGNLAVGSAIISSMMSGASGDKIALAGILAYAGQAAGQYVGSAMDSIFTQTGTGGFEALAGTGWAGVGANDIWSIVEQIGMQALKTVATNAVKASFKYALGSMFGGGAGGGSAEFSFGGIDSDMGWLSELMGGIAPKSSGFGFALDRGLSYVPYDNFPARLHEGERVLTKEENRAGRSINFSPGSIVINGSNLSPAQMAKEIVRPLKEELRRINARYN